MRRKRFFEGIRAIAVLGLFGFIAADVVVAQAGSMDKEEIFRRVQEHAERLRTSVDVKLNISKHKKLDIAPEALEKITDLRRNLRQQDMNRASGSDKSWHQRFVDRTGEEFKALVDRRESYEVRYCTDGSRWRLEERALTPSPYLSPEWMTNILAPTIHATDPGGRTATYHGYAVDQADRSSIFDGKAGWHLNHVTDEMRNIVEKNMENPVTLIEHAARIDNEGQVSDHEKFYEQWFEPCPFGFPVRYVPMDARDAEGQPGIVVLTVKVADLDVEYYVDTSKGFAVTKAVAKKEGEVRLSWEATAWEEQQGIWYPKAVEVHTKEPSALWHVAGAREVSPPQDADVTMQIEVVSVDFEPQLDESEFTPKFPANTRFSDMRFPNPDGSVLTYTSSKPLEGAAAVNGLVVTKLRGTSVDLSFLLEDLEVGAQAPEATPEEPVADEAAAKAEQPTDEPQVPRRGVWAYLIAAGIICVVLVAIALAVRGRRSGA